MKGTETEAVTTRTDNEYKTTAIRWSARSVSTATDDKTRTKQKVRNAMEHKLIEKRN